MANKLQNEIRIDGTLGRDSESKYTASGKRIINFSICYNSGKKNAQGTWDKVANWFDCQYWHDDPNDADLLVKGQLIKVIGELRQEKWIDKTTSQERSKVIINVQEVILLDKDVIYGKGNSQSSNQAVSYQGPNKVQNVSDDQFEDDIPF